MNKNVNPFLAAAILVIFGGFLALKFYFYDKALSVPKVQYIKKSSESSISIRLDGKLYDYSIEGELNKVIDLRDLGINGKMGDFDFFSNGDLLINSDEYQRNFDENLDAYARKKNKTTTLASEGRGLFRCDLVRNICKVFNKTIPEIQGAHYLHIDQTTDEVYLADTSRNEIRKLSATGELLAELKVGLIFPNQVYLERNKLWVVDTNHHVMKAVDPKTENFGKTLEEHKTISTKSWVWPSAFSRVGSSWWVNISDAAMENAKVILYDSDWQKESELDLPKNADPVTSVFVGGRVIIADTQNYTLYQFDDVGTRLGDFLSTESDNLSTILKTNKALDKQYQLWSNIMLWLMIAAFIPLFIYAIFKSVKDSKGEQEEWQALKNKTEEDKIIQLAKLPLSGEWLEAKPMFKHIKWIILGMYGILASSFFLLFSLYSDSEKLIPHELFFMMVFFTAFITLMLIPMLKISQYKIGFLKTNVTIETDKGKLISAPYDEIKWTDRAFIVNGWFVPIGNAGKSVFSYEKLQQRLTPYLSPNNKLGQVDFLKQQWSSPEATLKYMTMAIVLAVFFMVYMERVKITTFFSLV